MTELPAGETHSFVTFRLGGSCFGLPLAGVAQILPMVKITPLPRLGPAMAGVILLRGEFVAVIHLARQLGLPAAALQLDTPILLARIAGQTLGLIVDEVLDVVSLANEEITPLASLLPPATPPTPLVSGVSSLQPGAQAREPLILLAPQHLLLPGQAGELEAALAAINAQRALPAPEGQEAVEA